MFAIITIGYREYAIPLSQAEKVITLLQDAVEVEGHWTGEKRVYHRMADQRDLVPAAVIYNGNLLSPRTED